MRRICVWSGKRGGFGALVPTMESITQHPDLELLLVVTDQHLYDQFGKTVTEVESQFPIAARIDMAQGGDTNADRARAIGHCVEESVGVIQELAPDILLIIGDRGRCWPRLSSPTTCASQLPTSKEVMFLEVWTSPFVTR